MEAPSSSSFYFAILTLLIFLHSISSTQATSPSLRITDTHFIEKSCNSTLYPDLCYKYLSRYASRIGKSPRLLAQTAIAVSLSTTRSTFVKLKNYSRTLKMNDRQIAAMRDCLEEVSDSVYELKISLKEMGHAHPGSSSTFVVVMGNVETWVSAALTDDDTCIDGFSGRNMNGKAKIIARRLVRNIAHLASIALTFINSYASSG